MKFKPYPKYKDSRIKWIGEIPEGWEINKIKNTNYVKGRIGWHGLSSEEYQDEGAFLVTGTNFFNGHIDWSSCHHISWERYEEDPYIHLRENDVLITKDGTIGKIALIENLLDKATLNSGVFINRPLNNKKHISHFMFWILNSLVFEKFFDFAKRGATISHLYQETFERFNFPLPSIEEQKIIVKYLNGKIFKIDTLIAKDRKLIELLKEKRIALINHAVTKGLDPNAKIKDSGIDWIGEIPIGWETRKVSRSFDIVGSGTTPKSQETSYYDKGDIPWIITGDLNDNLLKKSSKKITKEAVRNYSVLKMYPKNSIIIAMYGATIGKTALLSIEACTNQACCVLARSRFFETKYVFYWFIANRNNITSYSYGGGQPNISQDVIKNLKIPNPPRPEQKKIIDYLDKTTVKIDKTIQKIEEKIKLLEEYKKSLIHHTVTGKIDVREVV